MDYPRRDAVRAQRARYEAQRRIRTSRPRRGGLPFITWAMEGLITLDRFFLPHPATIDPLQEGYLPEYKQILAIDGWLHAGGDVTISWQGNDDYFYLNHLIVAGGFGNANRIWLDEPFIIENGETFGAESVRPEIQLEPEYPAANLACYALYEVIPV